MYNIYYPYNNKKNESFVNSFEFDPSILTVYKSPYEKKRVGKNNDGGYVIDIIPDIKYNLIIGCGISNDISFEENFINIYKNISCIVFDGTIDDIPETKEDILFVKKNIGIDNTSSITNLHNLIMNNENIFLKMDIEGYEIPWFESLTYEMLDKILQMVLEFHSPFSERETNVFKKISKTHVMVHLHGNNCGELKTFKNIIIPETFECTFINKKYLKEPYILNTDKLPLSLDMPNKENSIDYDLNYKPFTN